MIADEHGAEIITTDAPASAIVPGREEESAHIIATAVRDALDAASMSHVVPKVLCVGLAGAGRDAERQAIWQALASRDLAEEIVVHADATIALDDAFVDGAGILLIAGTGSIAYGRGPTGAVARCGGWGNVAGDEGSAFWIGRRALSIVTAAHDGREPETALTGAILTAAEIDQVDDLIRWAATASTATIAGLAPSVMGIADSGDLRAQALVSLAAEELVIHVRTLARKLFADERASVPVALGGGLLHPGSALRKRVEHRLKSVVPGAQLSHEAVVPVRGAVRGALRFLGITSA
jgi:glucosamine kinase